MGIIPDRLKNHLARTYGVGENDIFELGKAFERQYHKLLKERGESKERERAYGGGRKRLLSPEEVFFLVLIKLRYNPIFFLLGWMFGISEASAYRYFRDGLEALERILPVPLPCNKGLKLIMEDYKEGKIRKIDKMEELFEIFERGTFRKLIVDGSEQEINSPKDKEGRKKYYSGKEKDHTAKIEIATEGRLIMWLKGMSEGSKHDIKMLEEGILEELNKFGRGERIELFFDKGYEGVEKKINSGRLKVRIPKKKRKGLSEEEKERNRIISQERVDVERVIGRIKMSRMLNERYRGKDRDKGFPILLSCYRVVSGLINYGKGGRWREGNLVA